jgi:hypothetical protein
MGTREHLLKLGSLDPPLQFVVEPLDLDEGLIILMLRTQFDEYVDVLDLTVEPVPRLHDLFEGGPLLQDLLGRLLVIPETGVGNLRFEFLDVLPLAVDVKETPEA